jgi:glycosyltransferase involved in cell wall biosynthesis
MALVINGRPLRVCFVAVTIYPTLCPDAGVASIGGAEVQQKLLGEALAAQGAAVSYVTQDHGQPDAWRTGGLTVYKSYRDADGIPGLRFFYPRVPSLWAALGRADADIYYVRGAGYLPALVALFCHRHRRRFVFSSASDANVDLDLLRLPTPRDRWLYMAGLRRADAIVVQSNLQALKLNRTFGLTGHVIRNVWSGCGRALPPRQRRYVLWVAMFRELKQPEHFLRLARVFPDEEFVMVGGPLPATAAYFERIREQAATVPNLRFLGYRSLAETERLFDEAKLLVNTSRHEGFPNTFLQAWSRGVPVLSYVDPDQLIERYGLGAVAAGEADMAATFARLLAGGSRAEDILAYFNANHSPAEIVARYEQIFARLSRPSRWPMTERWLH